MNVILNREQAIRVLNNYRGLVSCSITRQSILPEFLDSISNNGDPRLLCQTRGLAFLSDYYSLFRTDTSIDDAVRIKNGMRLQYKKGVNQWRSSVQSSSHASLYEESFVIYSFAKFMQVSFSAEEYVETRSLLYSLFDRYPDVNTIMESLRFNNYYVQDTLMHYFEACLEFYLLKNDDTSREYCNMLLQVLNDHFYDEINRLVAETISENGSILDYQPGHTYEWLSLICKSDGHGLKRLDEYLDTPRIEHLESVSVSKQGVVLSELNTSLIPKNIDTYRIWPSAERIRFLCLSKSNKAHTALSRFLDLFTTNEYGINEYWNVREKQLQETKSTTGYHLFSALGAYLVATNSLGE